jgi:DNA repair exonuclease SbcCD ATPase subunit
MSYLVSPSLLLRNASILETYKELRNANRQPKLAVYNENQLLIVSTKARKCHEYIIEFFKKCLYFCCEKMGLLSYNSSSIQEIERSIEDFYSEQKTRIGTSISYSIDEQKQILQKLSQEIAEGEQILLQAATLKPQINSLKDAQQSESRTLDVIRQQIEILKPELKSLEEKKSELDQVKQELSTLKPMLQDNLLKIQQLKDFEEAIHKLSHKKSKLENQIISLVSQLGQVENAHKAFEEGRLAERKAIQQRTNAEFPERAQWYCEQCIAAAAYEVSKKGTPVRAGDRINNISAVCQGKAHNGDRYIFSGYHLVKC